MLGNWIIILIIYFKFFGIIYNVDLIMSYDKKLWKKN